MMNTYRQGGSARVYWLTLPIPRDGDLAEVARAVNAAIEVAAQPYRAQVRVLDMSELFTPGGRYRDAMTVDGRSADRARARRHPPQRRRRRAGGGPGAGGGRARDFGD